MIRREFSDPSAGAVVYWSCGTTPRGALRDRLLWLGLEEMMPAERTDASALKAALASVCKSEKGEDKDDDCLIDYAVQPHKNQGKDGYDVASVRRYVDRNSTSQEFGAKVVGGRVQITHGFCTSLYDLQRSFEHFKTELSGSAVSAFLVKMVLKLGGVTLREKGGVYYVPSRAIEGWTQIADAVEEAGGFDKENNRVNQCYLLLTPMTAQTFRAVRDAITAEVTAESEAIAAEIAKGEIGQEALENRRDKLAGLVGRVAEYEEILGEGLPKVRSVLDIVHQAIALTCMSLV